MNTFKALRTKVRLSQTQMAEYLGVDQSLISKFENDKRNLSVAKIERACNLFGISYGDYVSGNIDNQLQGYYKGMSVKTLNDLANVNKITMNALEMDKLKVERIKGGDIVRLKDGKIVTVGDIHNDEIVVTYIERYKISDITEIIDRLD